MSEIQALRRKHSDICDFPVKDCIDPTMGWLHCICPTAGRENCGWCNRDSLNGLNINKYNAKDFLDDEGEEQKIIDGFWS